MFRSEQSHPRKAQNPSKKKDWRIGTPFVKPVTVKRSFTFKEVSLIAGIVVALVIVFTIWFNQDPSNQPSSVGLRDKALHSFRDAAKSFLMKKFAEIKI
jgi:hypothetical protein